MQFKAEHGHCRVPISMPELGKWAKYQRDQYAQFVRGKEHVKIDREKFDRLVALGFGASLDEGVAAGLVGEGNAGPEEPLAPDGGPPQREAAVASRAPHAAAPEAHASEANRRQREVAMTSQAARVSVPMAPALDDSYRQREAAAAGRAPIVAVLAAHNPHGVSHLGPATRAAPTGQSHAELYPPRDREHARGGAQPGLDAAHQYQDGGGTGEIYEA